MSDTTEAVNVSCAHRLAPLLLRGIRGYCEAREGVLVFEEE